MKGKSGAYLPTLSPATSSRSHDGAFRRFFLGFGCALLLLVFLFASIQLIPFRGHQNSSHSALILERLTGINIPEFEIPINQTATQLRTNCTYYTCFDVYKCSHSHTGMIGVYIYPLLEYVDEEGAPITRKITQEFHDLVRAIINSPYYTPDPSKACVFIPLIDLLNQNRFRARDIGRALSTLP